MYNDMNTTDVVRMFIQGFFDLLILVIIPSCLKLFYDMAEMKTNMRWVMGGLKILGDKAGVVLHSPHTPEFDTLIEKFWHGKLTQEEARLLCKKLSMIIHEDPDNPICPGIPYTPGQKSTATQMLVAVSTICRVTGNECDI